MCALDICFYLFLCPSGPELLNAFLVKKFALHLLCDLQCVELISRSYKPFYNEWEDPKSFLKSHRVILWKMLRIAWQ